MEGTKKIKSKSFHQYSWNSEVETTWTGLICWHHKTSNTLVALILETIPISYPSGARFIALRNIVLKLAFKRVRIFLMHASSFLVDQKSTYLYKYSIYVRESSCAKETLNSYVEKMRWVGGSKIALSRPSTLSVLRIFVHSVSCHFPCQNLCN